MTLNVKITELSDLACWYSDGFVRVQHNSKSGTNRSWGQVFGELCADKPVVAVAGNDSSPHGLVAGVSLHVLGLEDKSDALSVVESGCEAIIAVLDLQDCVLLGLGGFATSEIHKCCFLVQSTSIRQN